MLIPSPLTPGYTLQSPDNILIAPSYTYVPRENQEIYTAVTPLQAIVCTNYNIIIDTCTGVSLH